MIGALHVPVLGCTVDMMEPPGHFFSDVGISIRYLLENEVEKPPVPVRDIMTDCVRTT